MHLASSRLHAILLAVMPWGLEGRRAFSLSCRSNARPSTKLLTIPALSQASEHQEAKAWLDGFTSSDIPKSGYEVSWSRSSGPGGQHVNKTSTKATLRCGIKEATKSWLPPFLVPALSLTPSFIPNQQCILISSSEHRSAPLNLEACVRKLHTLVLASGRSVLVKEATPEQQARVRALAKAEDARRKKSKELRGSKKSGRREGRAGWD